MKNAKGIYDKWKTVYKNSVCPCPQSYYFGSYSVILICSWEIRFQIRNPYFPTSSIKNDPTPFNTILNSKKNFFPSPNVLPFWTHKSLQLLFWIFWHFFNNNMVVFWFNMKIISLNSLRNFIWNLKLLSFTRDTSSNIFDLH